MADLNSRIRDCVARRDAKTAVALISEIQAKLAAGTASGPGWAEDLEKLAAVAGVPLDKAAPSRGAERMEKRVTNYDQLTAMLTRADQSASLAKGMPGAMQLPGYLENAAADAVARFKSADANKKAAAAAHGAAVKQQIDEYIARALALDAIGQVQRSGPKSMKGAWA